MSGQNWSILITPASAPGGAAVFTPNLPNQTPGEPLQTGNGDIVSWNNKTSEEHQPWPLGPDGKPLTEEEAKDQLLYLSNPIPAWTPSSPGYVTHASQTQQSITIDYTCTFHPDEKGSLIVWNQ